jgi:hypothetical protein
MNYQSHYGQRPALSSSSAIQLEFGGDLISGGPALGRTRVSLPAPPGFPRRRHRCWWRPIVFTQVRTPGRDRSG